MSLAGGGYVSSDGQQVSLAGCMFPVIATRCHSRGYVQRGWGYVRGWVCLGLGMSRGPCTVNSKLNKFKHVRGGGGVSRGPCTVRSKLNKFKHDQGGRSLSSEVPEW